MKLIIDLAKPFSADMRVDLGCGYLAMPQHELNRPQVRSSLQKVSGKGMAQNMRTYFRVQTGLQGVGF